MFIYNWIARPMEKFVVEVVKDEEEAVAPIPARAIIDGRSFDKLTIRDMASTTSVFTRLGIQSARQLDAPSRTFGSSAWFMSVRGLEGVRVDGVSRDSHRSAKERRRCARAYLPGTLGSAISINSSRYFSSMMATDPIQVPISSLQNINGAKV